MKLSVRDLCHIALGSVMMMICAWLVIPLGIPITMQTFGVFTVLQVLGGKKGTLSILLYLLIGLFGLPVFAGFKGGFSAFFSFSGGFLIGFLLIGFLYWAFEKKMMSNMRMKIMILLAGLVICYATGCLWYLFIANMNQNETGIWVVLTVCVLPFIIPDLLKLIFSVIFSQRVFKYIQ